MPSAANNRRGLRGAALMRFRRIHGLRAADHRRRPLLVPEGRRHHRRLERCDRMRRDSVERPGAHGRVEILEHAVLGVRARGRGREIADLSRRRAIRDRAHALAGQQRKRIDEAQPGDTLTRQLCRFQNHHAARARAREHDVTQVFVEEEIGNLLGVRRHGDAGPNLMSPFAAPVERGRIRNVPLCAQARGDWFPDPAPLIRAVNHDERRHRLRSTR